LDEMNEYRITELGRDIRQSAWRYLEKKPRVAESEMKEAKAATEAMRESEHAPAEKKPKRARQPAAGTKVR
jgi:hypothetical protein